jgi:hypothetical protein
MRRRTAETLGQIADVVTNEERDASTTAQVKFSVRCRDLAASTEAGNYRPRDLAMCTFPCHREMVHGCVSRPRHRSGQVAAPSAPSPQKIVFDRLRS